MPRRTAKPYLKIQKVGDKFRISHYVVVNSRAMLAKTIFVERENPEAFAEQVGALVAETRERFSTQRSV